MDSSTNQSMEELPPQVNKTSTERVMKRPANGFLAFCHRHRETVSLRNERLENRLVTKILGSWWSFLRPEERKVYEDKANEFKTMFFAANPGYKWYNQKPSTGHTPVTRQSNRRGRKLENSPASNTITPGKLADESQMGGLSSLMLPIGDQPKKRHQDISYISSEHDYLETNGENNNTIMPGDVDQMQECTQAGCGLRRCTESILQEQVELNEYANRGVETNDDVSDSSLSSPKKQIRAKESYNIPPFCDFVKSCPIYSYDAFLEQKAERSPSSKRLLAKRRKWQQALDEYRNGEAAEPTVIRRRKKRRTGNYRPQKRRPAEHSEGETSSSIPPSSPLDLQQSLSNSNYPKLSNIDLLVSAAATLENGHPEACDFFEDENAKHQVTQNIGSPY